MVRGYTYSLYFLALEKSVQAPIPFCYIVERDVSEFSQFNTCNL
jgi:hypothetical protein